MLKSDPRLSCHIINKLEDRHNKTEMISHSRYVSLPLKNLCSMISAGCPTKAIKSQCSWSLTMKLIIQLWGHNLRWLEGHRGPGDHWLHSLVLKDWGQKIGHTVELWWLRDVCCGVWPPFGLFMLIENGAKIMHYSKKSCSAAMLSCLHAETALHARTSHCWLRVCSLCLPIPCQSQPPSPDQSRWFGLFGLLLSQSAQCSSQPE